ncbi:uncharacterized protein LOC111188191 isoform X2 [Astyanax mexicanus]|uniref:Uncharacterized protein n=1 Tax=Astyanax mexicanus TaxID=7994 RepID=A0A8T2LSY3_ASTMX|nr:uncharacterized protein LOC111188191 isoform X2 [Astyanax mexicanus]KAG9274819.1 hypothetical protein AMEX_G9266 [Astyanax mexicanus]
MLYLLGIICGLLCILMFISNGLSQQKTQRGSKGGRGSAEKKKKDYSEKELHFIIRILSIGLVDADPHTLHHLKEYRDLQGGST